MSKESATTEQISVEKAPAETGAFSAPKKSTAKRPASAIEFSPRLTTEKASALITDVQPNGIRGGSSRDILGKVQKHYGNQYTTGVVSVLRSKADAADKEEKKSSSEERKKKTTPDTMTIAQDVPAKPVEPIAASPVEVEKEPAPATPVEQKTLPPAGPEPAPATAPPREEATKEGATDESAVPPAEAPKAAATESPTTAAGPGAKPGEAPSKVKKKPAVALAEKPKAKGAPSEAAAEASTKEVAEIAPGGIAAKLMEMGAAAFASAQTRVKKLAKRQKAHKPAKKKVGEAKAAVIPPKKEAQSRTNARQVDQVEARPVPKTNETVVKKTMNRSVSAATPKTLEDVDDFKKRGGAQGIRAAVLGNVRSQTKKVQDNYADVGQAPETPAPAGNNPPVPEPETAQPTGALNLGKDLVPEVPAENLDVSNFEKDVEKQMQEEGLDEETLAQVDSGPLAEARAQRTEMKKEVDEGPKAVRLAESAEKKNMEDTLGADEKSERRRMGGDRKRELNASKQKQENAKQKEQTERQRITEEINRIYKRAKDKVEGKLSNLEKTALKNFDDGQKGATARFEDTVKRDMDAFKKKRYSGLVGKGKWAWDKLAGLDDNPKVLKIFENAKKTFVNEIDTLIGKIMADSKLVIEECKTEIQNAKKEIAVFIKSLKPSQQKIAATAQKEIMAKLNALERKVADKEKELKEKLDKRREQAIKAIDEKIAKMKEKLKGLAGKLAGLLLNALMKLFRWALEKVGAPVEKIIGSLKRAGSAFKTIIKDPVKFLGNLLSAIGRGFKQFGKNIWQHLKAGFMAWLFGAVAKIGITIPKEFSLKAILGLVLQILGITADKIKKKVAKYIGEENVERIAKVWEVVKTFITKGVAGLWELIKDYLTNLKELVVGAIQDWIITQIVKQAVIWLISLFNPVGAIIKAIVTIYKVVMFIIERIQQILAVLEAILSSLAEIAVGAIGKAADWIEKSLASLVPVVIGFLASLLGISGITEKIREVINKIQKKVDNALDKVIAKIAAGIKKVVTKVGKFLGVSKDKDKKPDPNKSPEEQAREERKRAAAGIVTAAMQKGIRRDELIKLLASLKKKYQLKSVELTKDDDVVITNSDPEKIKGESVELRISEPVEEGKRKKVSKDEKGIVVGKFTPTTSSQNTAKSVIAPHIQKWPYNSWPDGSVARPEQAEAELYLKVKNIQRVSTASAPGVVREFGNLERKLEKPTGGRQDYQAGHLIANEFGGRESFENLVPQRKKLNEQVYTTVEQWVRGLLPKEKDKKQQDDQMGNLKMVVTLAYGADIRKLTVADAAASLQARLDTRYYQAKGLEKIARERLDQFDPSTEEYQRAEKYLKMKETQLVNEETLKTLGKEYLQATGVNAPLEPIATRIPTSMTVNVEFDADVDAAGKPIENYEEKKRRHGEVGKVVANPIVVLEGASESKKNGAGKKQDAQQPGTKKIRASKQFVLTEK